MKYAVALILAVLISGCYHQNTAFYRPGMMKEKVYIANHNASVQLVYYTADGPRSLTSGVVLSKKHGLVLTVAHGVSSDTKFVVVRPPPGAENEEEGKIFAKVIAMQHESDPALGDLMVVYVDPEIAEFQHDVSVFSGTSKEIEHEPVYLVSYPLGILNHVTSFGYIIGLFPKNVLGLVPHLTVDIWAQPGSSGGGLYLQKNHKLIGLTRVYMGGGGMYPTLLFITPEQIRTFLEKNNIEYRK